MRISIPPVTAILDARVPTATPSMSEETRHEILDHFQPGDRLLETNHDAYPNRQRLEQLAFRSSSTHTSILEGRQNGKPVILEAATPAVRPDCRKNYDTRFHSADNTFYPSELVYKALKSMPQPDAFLALPNAKHF